MGIGRKRERERRRETVLGAKKFGLYEVQYRGSGRGEQGRSGLSLGAGREKSFGFWSSLVWSGLVCSVSCVRCGEQGAEGSCGRTRGAGGVPLSLALMKVP